MFTQEQVTELVGVHVRINFTINGELFHGKMFSSRAPYTFTGVVLGLANRHMARAEQHILIQEDDLHTYPGGYRVVPLDEIIGIALCPHRKVKV